MFRRDLHKLLVEAPIDQIHAVGDFSKAASFRKAPDRALVSKPERWEKIRAAWAKTDEVFNIWLLNQKGAGKHSEHGTMSPAEVQKELKLDIKTEGSDAINIVFVGNSGAEWRAMTPWIMAHRFGHAISATNRFSKKDPNMGHQKLELDNYVDKTFKGLHECYNFPTSPEASKYGFTGMANDKDMKFLAQAFCTFKSARERNLRAYFEVHNELLAQYLLTGDVKFNEPPPTVTTRMAWGKSQGVSLKRDKQEDAEDLIRDLQNTYGYLVQNLLSTCVGKIFVM